MECGDGGWKDARDEGKDEHLDCCWCCLMIKMMMKMKMTKMMMAGAFFF